MTETLPALKSTTVTILLKFCCVWWLWKCNPLPSLSLLTQFLSVLASFIQCFSSCCQSMDLPAGTWRQAVSATVQAVEEHPCCWWAGSFIPCRGLCWYPGSPCSWCIRAVFCSVQADISSCRWWWEQEEFNVSALTAPALWKGNEYKHSSLPLRPGSG